MKPGSGLYIIAVIIILLAFSQILAGNIYYFRDFSAYVFPLKYFLKAEVSRGCLPFLVPYSNLDVPFFANPQAGTFYPLSVIIYVLPILPGLKAYIIVHFFIVSFSMYYFIRQALGLQRIVALYGGLTLALSGFFLSLVEYLSILSTLAYFPLALAFIKKAVGDGKRRYWVFTGLVFSLQFLGGKPDHAALCMGVSYLYAVYLSFCGKRDYLKTTLFFFLSAFVFLSVSLPQILPFLEFFADSDRWMGTFEIITKGSVHPLETLKFLIPDIFGDYKTDVRHFWFGQIYFTSFYIGIAPLLLALFSFRGEGSRRRVSGFFTALFLAGLFLSFGRFTPLYGLLFRIFPVIRFMQYPSKFMYFAVFSLVALSSLGLDNYMSLIGSGRYDMVKVRIRRLVLIAAALSSVLLLAFVFQGRIKKFFAHAFLLHADFLDFEFDYIFTRLLKLAAVLFIFAMPLKVLLDRRTGPYQCACFVAAFAAFNLLCCGFNANPVVKDGFFTQKPRISRYFGHRDQSRILFLDDEERSIFLFRNYPPGYPLWEAYHAVHKELMYPNINLIYGFSSPDSMWVLEPKPDMKSFLDAENVNMLSLSNVGYVYTAKEIKNEAYELVGSVRYDEFLYPVNIYRNKKVLPKVFFTAGFRVVEDHAAIPEMIGKSGFDPEREILLGDYPEESFLTQGRKKPVAYKINSSRIDTDTTEVDIEAEDDGFLFVSRRYSRDWKCMANGMPAPVYRADHFFQAVPLRKGRNIVKLTYAPGAFIYAAAGGAASLFLLAAYLFLGGRGR